MSLKTLIIFFFLVTIKLTAQDIAVIQYGGGGDWYSNPTALSNLIKFCNEENIMIKEHNGDYLGESTLRYHPKIGIHGINVAPEFGVIETKAILTYFEQNNLEGFKEKFIDIAYNSKKWEKWIMPNSTTTKKDKAIISGHYVFSSPEFKILKNEILEKIDDKNAFDNYLKTEIKNSVLKYLNCLNMIST